MEENKGMDILRSRTDRKETAGSNVGLTDLFLELLNTKWRREDEYLM